MQSWRGLIARKQVFACEPFEILGLHCRSCSERGTMCLPAHGAMAIQRPSQRSVDAIANLTAQTTALDSHSSAPFRDICCHVVPSDTIIINGKLLFAETLGNTELGTGASRHGICRPDADLTLTNAIIVTAAVSRQLFPKELHPGNERNLAITTGLGNLIAAPFWGLSEVPRCRRHCWSRALRRAPISQAASRLSAIFNGHAPSGPSALALDATAWGVISGCCRSPAQSDLGEPPVRPSRPHDPRVIPIHDEYPGHGPLAVRTVAVARPASVHRERAAAVGQGASIPLVQMSGFPSNSLVATLGSSEG